MGPSGSLQSSPSSQSANFKDLKKSVPLYVSDHGDNFKPIIKPLIGSSENFVFKEKVVPLFNSNTLMKLRSLSEQQKANYGMYYRKPIKNQLGGLPIFSWHNEWS